MNRMLSGEALRDCDCDCGALKVSLICILVHVFVVCKQSSVLSRKSQAATQSSCFVPTAEEGLALVSANMHRFGLLLVSVIASWPQTIVTWVCHTGRRALAARRPGGHAGQ